MSEVTEISDEELLYRGVNKHNFNFKENRISTSLFKDPKGVSVDRSLNRNQDDCISFLCSFREPTYFLYFCELETRKVRTDIQIYAIHKPIDSNEFHSELHENSNQQGLKKKSIQKRLLEASTIIENNTKSEKPHTKDA